MSDDERREVARRLRELASDAEEVSDFDLAKTLDLGAVSRYGYDPNDVERLADLIEPAPTSSDRGPTPDPTERGVDSIYDWCLERLEGADGEEDFLYCSIMSAIEEYRHPERVTARTARPVDREALLDVLDEMDTTVRCAGPDVERDCVGAWAGRIRKACGGGGFMRKLAKTMVAAFLLGVAAGLLLLALTGCTAKTRVNQVLNGWPESVEFSQLEGGQTRFSSHDGGIEGLAVVVDHRTGVQYLVTAAGACPLLDADGTPLLVLEAGE